MTIGGPCLAVLVVLAGTLAAPGSSKWVYPGTDGRLRYSADARGNRISGAQILLHRSTVGGTRVWPVVTEAGVTGPNVVLHFKADEAGVAPHQRWATGQLVDSSEFTNGTDRRPGIAFSNREHAGSGHGWSAGWSVAWNVKTDVHLIQQPPGAKNWCIGCTGRPAPILWHGGPIAVPQIPSETFESAGVMVTPTSLYLAQLQDRLGPAAVRNIGYLPR